MRQILNETTPELVRHEYFQYLWLRNEHKVHYVFNMDVCRNEDKSLNATSLWLIIMCIEL